jgi:hypothetical protein
MKVSALIKSLIVLLLFTFFLPFVTSSAFAQAKTASISSYPVANTDSDIPNNLHNWTQKVMIETMLSLTCQLTGIDPTTPSKQCLGVDQKTGKIGFLPTGDLAKGQIGGAIGGMNNMISLLYNPPVHPSDYFQNLASNFGITKKTYAYETGFEGLSPLLDLWSAFRNMVYLLFVIVFVIIGLAIMLRIKIDPRTVMTIQNQIPKIIIGILLVTFSFAIAGFLVDAMWTFIYLIFGLISGISGTIATNVSPLNPAALQGQNPFSGVGGIGGVFGMANSVALSTQPIIRDFLGIGTAPLISTQQDIIGLITGLKLPGSGKLITDFLIDAASVNYGLSVGQKISTMIGDYSALSVEVNVGAVPGFVAGIDTFLLAELGLRFIIPYGVVFIVIMFALFAALFRLWFSLLMSYLSILIDVVLAPFWIAGSLIPGSPVNVSGWFRDLIANLATFPAVIFMFLLAKVFVSGFATSTDAFIPPLIGNVNQGMLSSIIGIGMILITPNIANLVKQALKAPKGNIMGEAMRGIGVGVGIPMNIARQAVGVRQGMNELVIKGVDKETGTKAVYGTRSLGNVLGLKFGRGG